MNALTIVPPPPLAYSEMERLAEAIAKSNLFGMKTKDQALVLMAIAQAEGRHPALAARDYDVINNRPAKKAEAMLRDFLSAGGTVKWHSLTDELADATFTHPQTGSVRIDWDMKRAQTAFGKKDMYAKFPRQMLRSRVVSEGVRTLWPLATSGMYEPGEAADIQAEHNGPTIEHTASDERAAINDAVPLKPAAAATPRGKRKVDPNVYETASETDEQKWLRNLETKLSLAQSRAEVVAVGGLNSVKDAVQSGPPEVQRRVSELLADAYERLPEEEFTDEELGEVEIAGEEKMAAGD